MTANPGSNTMLHGRLVRHGTDLEQAARRALTGYCTRKQANLGNADREDAIAYLTSEAWIIAERFDESRGAPFASVVHSQLSFRTTDWFRIRFGRTRWTFSTHEYVRERPIPLSLDGPAGPDGDGPSLDEFVANGQSDRETDREPVGGGLLAERDVCEEGRVHAHQVVQGVRRRGGALGASESTVHRSLKELAADGYLTELQATKGSRRMIVYMPLISRMKLSQCGCSNRLTIAPTSRMRR